MKKSDLVLDWCTYSAAKYAVENWHYSRCFPRFNIVRVGVWEASRFAGVILFGNGACPQIACPFGIDRLEAAELVRVALRDHRFPVSRIVAIALRLLRKLAPKLRVVVSYADPEQGHHGGIYQAGGWVYLGETAPIEWFVDKRTKRRIHTKTLRTGRRGLATRMKAAGKIESIYLRKLKYAMPLDDAMRRQLAPLAKPYPKRAGSIVADVPSDQDGEGGSIPTPALIATPEHEPQGGDDGIQGG